VDMIINATIKDTIIFKTNFHDFQFLCSLFLYAFGIFLIFQTSSEDLNTTSYFVFTLQEDLFFSFNSK
jgi:hypothetical protein